MLGVSMLPIRPVAMAGRCEREDQIFLFALVIPPGGRAVIVRQERGSSVF